MFPIVMLGTILCAISIERYSNVVHNSYHGMIVTNKSLTITIIIAVLISTTWALLSELIFKEQDKTKISTVSITASSYAAIMILRSAILNACLLRNVKQRINTSAIHQALDAKLTKTIVIILATLGGLYLPILILFIIVACIFINFTDARLNYKSGSILSWILILQQINAVTNSVIYFARNNHI